MSEQTQQATLTIRVNGDPQTVAPGTQISALVDPAWGRAIAVARNGEVVPRSRWESTTVEANDEIEIVHPIQGGHV